MYALQIKNRSESDPHSHEATYAVAKKARTKERKEGTSIIYQINFF